MKRQIAAIIACLLVLWFPVQSAHAKDRLAMGYTSASGVFAGMWLAHELKIFDKYNKELETSGFYRQLWGK